MDMIEAANDARVAGLVKRVKLGFVQKFRQQFPPILKAEHKKGSPQSHKHTGAMEGRFGQMLLEQSGGGLEGLGRAKKGLRMAGVIPEVASSSYPGLLPKAKAVMGSSGCTRGSRWPPEDTDKRPPKDAKKGTWTAENAVQEGLGDGRRNAEEVSLR